MKENLGGVEFFIPESTTLTVTPDDTDFKTTAAKTKTGLKRAVRAVTEGFSEELRLIAAELRPSEVELEIGLSFSEEANVWVLGLQSEQSIKLKLTWDMADH